MKGIKATLFQAESILRGTEDWSLIMRLLAATGVIVAIAFFRWLLEPWLHDYSFFLFEFGVVISAMCFGMPAGIWATIFSAFIIPYLFVGPPRTFDLAGKDVIALLIFILFCIIVSMAAEMKQRLIDQLRASHDEKDTLYRELYHRTRNNLHIISTTIAMQRRNASNPEVRANLEEVAERITGIARMSELLHRAGASGMLDARDYFLTLTGDLRFSLAARRPITIECEADAVLISRDVAETLGIVLNELVTNALKHAFADGMPGNLDLRFKATDREFILSVRDNGKGCAAEANEGTGWRIINSVVRRFHGTMTVEDAAPGCRAVLRLPREATT